MLLHRGFVVKVGNQCRQQKPFAFFPERVAAGPFTLGVGHQGRDQFQNILFAVDIGEGIVVHTLGKVNGIQDFQLVAVLQEGVPTLDHDTAFRIGDDIGAVAL